MRRFAMAVVLAAAWPVGVGPAQTAPAQGAAPFDPAEWRAMVAQLASDGFEGRRAGTPGFDRAADWVAARFRAAGLRPGGTDGWFQPVEIVRETLDPAASRVALVGAAGETVLGIGPDVLLFAREGLPPRIDAPLEFIGYGLHLPAAGHDDFAGRDLRGKIAVLVRGAPAGLDAKAVAQGYGEALPRKLREAGAVGAVQIVLPAPGDDAWPTDPSVRTATFVPGVSEPAPVAIAVNPASAAKLFAGVPGGYGALTAAAGAGRPLPRIALDRRLRATLATTRDVLRSRNVVGVLPGADATLGAESVVLSAHLDHLGLGEPGPDGKRPVHRGVMDNASGVASLIQVAQVFAKGPRPRRTLVFAAVTGEEMGLLGSDAFAARPPEAARRIVANINMDMFLPLAPMRRVVVYGAEESNLGAAARASATEMGVEMLYDPRPEERRLLRSDQYSFIRRGIPAISAKVEPVAGTPDAEYRRRWDKERYHQPADDLTQPISLQAASDYNRWLYGTIRRVADGTERPAWNPGSRFAGMGAGR